MNGEVRKRRQPTQWKANVMEMAPVATSLLLISASYSVTGVVLRDRTWVAVGVVSGITLALLPAIRFVLGRVRASDMDLLKSWFLLVPVVGWLGGSLLWRWIRTGIP